MTPEELLSKVTEFSKAHMSKFDKSHDFTHVMRVHDNAVILAMWMEQNENIAIDYNVVKISALIHDVNDHKYIEPGTTPRTIYEILHVDMGADCDLARLVEDIVEHVSYSYETKHGETAGYKRLMQIPEYAIVQDADRLDALGIHGVERTEIYTAAKGQPPSRVIEHFHEKLYKLPGMMKTTHGKILAEQAVKYVHEYEVVYKLSL